jgi:hypothetical protein
MNAPTIKNLTLSEHVTQRGSSRFQPHHAWDRNFVLLYVLFIWTGICMGFGPQIVKHVAEHASPYPLIVHFHAAAFVGWLTLLTAQVLLIRAGKVNIHRKLGVGGAVLAAIMLVIGPATAFTVQQLHFGKPGSDPAFLSVQLTDILAFAGLVTAGLVLRKQAAAHKRLILLATLYISDAGFARWLGESVSQWLGEGFWSTAASLYAVNDLLIVGMGVYDMTTRHRLHPVYAAGTAWVLANQLTGVSLLLSPAWKPWALRLIGH